MFTPTLNLLLMAMSQWIHKQTVTCEILDVSLIIARGVSHAENEREEEKISPSTTFGKTRESLQSYNLGSVRWLKRLLGEEMGERET